LAVDTGLHLSFTGIGLGLAMMWGLHKALVVSHATARVHHAAWRRGGNEHFATCGACLEAPEVERGNRYSALRMPLRVNKRLMHVSGHVGARTDIAFGKSCLNRIGGEAGTKPAMTL